MSKARLKKSKTATWSIADFQQRKSGNEPFTKVGNTLTNKDQLEFALDVGLVRDEVADQLSRDVRKPQRTGTEFRRVRDKRGNLVLSKAARHSTRQGVIVHRTRTQCGWHVPKSIWHTGKRLFTFAIPGFRWLWIHRAITNRCANATLRKVCCRYPKTFKFKGAPAMYVINAYLMTKKPLMKRVGDLKSGITEHNTSHCKQRMWPDVPDEFKSGERPYRSTKELGFNADFIKDNFKDGNCPKVLRLHCQRFRPNRYSAPYGRKIEQARQQATKWDYPCNLRCWTSMFSTRYCKAYQSRNRHHSIQKRHKGTSRCGYSPQVLRMGVSTYILTKAMRNPDSKNILAKMSELEIGVWSWKRYKKFIADAIKCNTKSTKIQNWRSEMLNDIGHHYGR